MLGILLDSSKWEMRLPVDKLAALQTDIQSWLECRQCTKRQLLSLVGSLSFAAKVVPPGRTFVRRLLDLAKSIPQLDTPFDLFKDARQDIKWWHTFLPTWNGRTFFHDVAWTRSPDLELYTDRRRRVMAPSSVTAGSTDAGRRNNRPDRSHGGSCTPSRWHAECGEKSGHRNDYASTATTKRWWRFARPGRANAHILWNLSGTCFSLPQRRIL